MDGLDDQTAARLDAIAQSARGPGVGQAAATELNASDRVRQWSFTHAPQAQKQTPSNSKS